MHRRRDIVCLAARWNALTFIIQLEYLWSSKLACAQHSCRSLPKKSHVRQQLQQIPPSCCCKPK